MAHKLINLEDSPLEIRLVKRTSAAVGLRNDILPAGAVNNTTEFTFKLGANAQYEHIVLAHSGTPNLVNKNDYITNGNLFTLTDSAESGARVINASMRLTETDPNYATKKIGVFYKVRASDAIYVLGDKPNSPAPVTYRVMKGGTTTTMSITDIMATKGAYFADEDYYVPLFLGTLKDLETSWLQGATGVITFTPHQTLGKNKVEHNVALVKVVPATGFTILNSEYTVAIGSNLTIETEVTPHNANVVEYVYSATPSTIATVADPAQPVVHVKASGLFEVKAQIRDELGNRIEATQEFFGIANITPYVTRFKTTADARTVSIKLSGTASGQSADIDWGDGTIENVPSIIGQTLTHTYTKNDTFDASFFLKGAVAVLEHNPAGGDDNILQSVVSWGGVNVANFRLTNCKSLVSVPETVPVAVTSFEGMFAGCVIFNQDINAWNVSNIKSFKNTFKGCSTFNHSLNSWNVSKGTTFESMFENATNFNQSIANWNTPLATSFKNMFANATSFNGNINAWDVSSVNDFSGMFKHAIAFEQGLNGWNTSSALNFAGMFQEADKFNQPLSNWNTSRVTNMSNMFAGTSTTPHHFNQDISMWDVNLVANLDGFLKYNPYFSQDLRWWCVSNVATRPQDFTAVGGAMVAENEPLWGLCPVQGSTVTIQNLPEYLMVGDAFTLTAVIAPSQPIQSVVWSIDNPSVALLGESTGELIFLAEGNATISVVVNGLFTTSVSVMVNSNIDPFTFQTVANSTINIDNPTAARITVDWGDGSRMTTNRADIVYTYTDGVDHAAKVSIAGDELPELVVSGGIREVTSWFGGRQPVIRFGKDYVDTALVAVPATAPTGWVDASYMFKYCTEFNGDISGWDTSNVNMMTGMFLGAAAFNQDISGWNVGQVLNMDFMFMGASSFSHDLVMWCVNGVTSLPANFATDASLFLKDQWPVWGTCPNRDLVTTIVTDKTTLGLGLKTRLSYTTTPAITITEESWSVSDSNIATISTRGLITAKAVGTIYVSLTLNKTYKATLRMDVTELDFDASIMVLDINAAINDDFYIANTSTTAPIIVDYGTGDVDEIAPGASKTYRYKEAGEYYIQISPSDEPMSLSLGGVYRRVLQWSSVGYSRLVLSDGSQSATRLIDVPMVEPAGLTSYEGMFYFTTSFNDDLSQWNTTGVTNMRNMFASASNFNGNIGGWDVSNVTNFEAMFGAATVFNQDISGWDTSSATNMKSMFSGAYVFNAPIGNWDVSSVTNMDMMFANTGAFNQDLRWWCVPNITSEPSWFTINAVKLTRQLFPVWGTCPNRNYGLTINSPAELATDATAELSYNLTPAETVVSEVWTSSDVAIATVSSTGEVTGVSPGTVTISLKLNGVYESSASITVIPGIVIEAPTNVTLVNLESPFNLTAELEAIV